MEDDIDERIADAFGILDNYKVIKNIFNWRMFLDKLNTFLN